MLNNDALGLIDGNLAAVGHGSTFTDTGGLINFVFDADEAPVAGASVFCGDGSDPTLCPVYYNTGLGEFGFSFVGEGGVATSTGADGLAVLPAAPVTTYSVSHADKSFDSATMGSLPGLAFFVAMYESVEE
jgi:hypothetical protein